MSAPADEMSKTSDISEEDTKFCDPCKENKEVVKAKATGFCVQCEEYLCNDCCTFHKKQKTLKTHTIKDAKEIPTNTTHHVKVDVCVEKCPTHSGKVMDFFCATCDQLACSVCAVIGHRECTNVLYIPDLVHEDPYTGQYENLKQRIKDIQATLNRQQVMHKLNKSKNDKQKQFAHQELQKQENEFLKIVKDKFESERAKIDKIHNENETKLIVYSKPIGSMTGTLNLLASDLQFKEDAKLKCQMFVTMKMTERKIQSITEQIGEIELYNRVPTYRFQADNNFIEAIRRINYKGKIDIERSEDNRHLEFSSEIELSDGDNTTVSPTGLCPLKEDTVVCVDENVRNNAIKLIDVVQNKIVSVLDVDGNPADVAKVDDDKFAVTFPIRKRIVFFAVSPNNALSDGGIINVTGMCRGIDYSHGNFFISYTGIDRRVEVMDTNGAVLKRFEVDAEGNYLFECPKYITFDPQLQVLYVSDRSHEAIFCLTLEGEIAGVYRDKDLSGPAGLCVDKTGSLYICAFGGNSIHRVSETLKKVTMFRDHKLFNSPASIAYCEASNKVYIGLVSANKKPVLKSFAIN